tara:strand:+ start:424 stop:744 length:321 start_codon:yes stop_codon:yes gene_type:complete
MKKPALRKNRYSKKEFKETKWTKSSKSLGEYIFRRLSLDQSDKELQNVRPRHMLSKLIVSSTEINTYVNDYLSMLDDAQVNSASELHVDMNLENDTNYINNNIPLS